MEATLLQSIIYFRKEDERWHERINEVLLKAKSYKFIRIVADEGNAVYPLLVKLKEDNLSKVDIVYLDKLITATKKQAILYSNYLKCNIPQKIILTKTETDVLKLLISGRKYREIEELMAISTNTVKFHVKNIYRKLNVTRKSQAIEKSKELNLV